MIFPGIAFGLGLYPTSRPIVTGGLGLGRSLAGEFEDVVSLRRISDRVVVDSAENALDVVPASTLADTLPVYVLADTVVLGATPVEFAAADGPLVDRVVRYRHSDVVERPTQ